MANGSDRDWASEFDMMYDPPSGPLGIDAITNTVPWEPAS